MRGKKVSVDFAKVIELSKQGLTAKEIAKTLNVGLSTLLRKLMENGTSITNIKNENSPQKRAWVTMRKDKMVAKYYGATSAGVKAATNKAFRKKFGISIKEYEATTSVATTAKKTPKPKTYFVHKDVESFIPFKVRELIESQNKRIERLETLLLQN